jgi:hypothetical protein
VAGFRTDVLADLARHGILPRTDSRPALIREFLNDMYRHELRRLRDRVLRGELARSELAGLVVALRRRYRLLSIPVSDWTKGD